LSLLKLKKTYNYTSEYKSNYEDAVDYRNEIAFEREKTKTYNQVFEIRHGFIPDLSIVDLLFNQGPRVMDYI